MRVLRALFVVFVIAVGGITGIPAAAAKEKIEHCTLEIRGIDKDGSYVTGPLECTTGPQAGRGGFSALTTYIAVHYDGFNLTGSTLSIIGGACTGGWLNVPNNWNDRISSTQSDCVTHHYRDANLSGTYNTTYAPGGNLSTVADQVTSVSYN